MRSDVTASQQSVFWYLKNFNLFDNFSRAELAEITKLLHLREFKKGQIITIPLDNAEKKKIVKAKTPITKNVQNHKVAEEAIRQRGYVIFLAKGDMPLLRS